MVQNILKNLGQLFFVLMFALSAFAKTAYLTDLEGRIEPLNQLLKDGTLTLSGNGRLDFTDSETKLVFGGDLMDRGPHTLRLMRYLTSLKRQYPDRVTLLWGNRDLNKLSFAIEREEKMSRLQDPKYKNYLQSKLDQFSESEKHRHNLESLNTPENQVTWWAQEYGLSKAIEFHHQELKELGQKEITYREAAADFADLLVNPSREYLKYIKLGQLVHSEGSVVYLHSGLPAQTGFVPDSPIIHEKFNLWEKAMNVWAQSQINNFIVGIHKGKLKGRGKKLAVYGDARFSNLVKKVWNHDNSVIYGPRYKEQDNFRLPNEQTLHWLKMNGKSTVVLGHSPAGNIPTLLRGKEILYVMADTSYSPNGEKAKITIDGDKIAVNGFLDNGTPVEYTTSVKDHTSPLGLKHDSGELVVGKTNKGELVLFKYIGFEKHERVVSENDLPTNSLHAPTYHSNAEVEGPKVALLKALDEGGSQVMDILTFENNILKEKVPVLFLGYSEYADESQEKIARSMIEEALNTLDPAKVAIVTESRDKLVHELASQKGFYLHGLVVSASLPEKVSNKVNSVSWVGHDGAMQPKTGMDLIRRNNGFGIILGGGGLVQKALEYGQTINAKFLVASTIKYGNGVSSASMNFAAKSHKFDFASSKELKRIILTSFPTTTKQELNNALLVPPKSLQKNQPVAGPKNQCTKLFL